MASCALSVLHSEPKLLWNKAVNLVLHNLKGTKKSVGKKTALRGVYKVPSQGVKSQVDQDKGLQGFLHKARFACIDVGLFAAVAERVESLNWAIVQHIEAQVRKDSHK